MANDEASDSGGRSDSSDYEVEAILSSRVQRGQTEYLVKWRGYDGDGEQPRTIGMPDHEFVSAGAPR